MNRVLKPVNVVTVVGLIIVPFVFLIMTFFDLIATNSFVVLGIVLLYLLLTAVGYWGGAIQGIRSIANGKAGTIRSASVFELILCVPELICSIYMISKHRRSSSSFDRTYGKVFLVIYAIMILLIIVKLLIVAKSSKTEEITAGSKGLAGRIVLICFGVPTIIALLIIGISKLVKAFPIIEKIFGFAVVIIIAAGILALIILVRSQFSSGDSGSSSSGSYSGSSGSWGGSNSRSDEAARREAEKKEAAERAAASAAEKAIIDDLNERYNNAFHSITGEYPWVLDFKIMKEGPKREAVKHLRERMTLEAKEKGVKGKTKWF